MDRLDCDRMFVAVVETGSFAGAARRMGASSGQASKLVSALERELGVQLLKRTTRALAVTEVGQAYFERMKLLLDELESLDNSVRNLASAPGGRLRLTAPLSFGQLRLVPLLLEFMGAYPDIQLDVDLSDNLRQLVDDGFDLAIRVGNPADSSLIARKLCDVRVMPVAAPAYLEAHGVPQHPDELSGHSCIIDSNFRDPNSWRFRSAESGLPLTVAVSGTFRISNGEACLAAAEAGLGVALVPDFIAHDALQRGSVRRLLEGWDDRPFGVYAIYPPARHLARKVRALVDYLADALGDA
ncbi:MAG: transcriptional regulator [Sphingomonas sp.]|nr:MAG: transcriptional regulator [Sphingomonas sp.]